MKNHEANILFWTTDKEAQLYCEDKLFEDFFKEIKSTDMSDMCECLIPFQINASQEAIEVLKKNNIFTEQKKVFNTDLIPHAIGVEQLEICDTYFDGNKKGKIYLICVDFHR